MYLMEQPHNSDYMNMGNDKFIMNIEMKPLSRDEHMNDNHGKMLDMALAHTLDIQPDSNYHDLTPPPYQTFSKQPW